MQRSERVYGAVALGSALGALSRYLCSAGVVDLLGPAFPWGTLSVNIAGSFIIGLFVALSDPLRASPGQRYFVTAGFCGGFTTFSVFSLENLLMIADGTSGLAVVYIAASLPLWLLGVWGGYRLGELLTPLAEQPSQRQR